MGQALWFRQGDIALVYSCWAGKDDEGAFHQYMEAYDAHEVPPSGNQKFPQTVYCPYINDRSSQKCPYCDEDYKTKHRLAIWFYVTYILHQQPRQGEQLPVVTFNGQNMFQRQVNGFRVWEVSAWHCYDEIMNEAGMRSSMHNTQFIIRSVGAQLDRKYLFSAYPESGPMPAELIARIPNECKPIYTWLEEQTTPPETIQRPSDQQMGGAVQQPYTPGSLASTLQLPQTSDPRKIF